MKYIFIIQGEGRGHMTQALSLSKILRKEGHEISHVIVGKSKRRNIPQFFLDKINAPLSHLDSPNFVTDKNQKSVKPFRTVVYSLLQASQYQKSLQRIDEIVNDTEPDFIINFYDFLGGLYNFSKRPKAKFISIAHQFLITHPEFDFPPKRQLDKISLRIGNKIASLGAHKILALSFQFFEDQPRKKLYVVPPLLRDEIKNITVSTADHFLAYMVNPGYGMEVEAFHEKFPEQPIHCFWDMKDKPNPYQIDENLTFHQLDDELFIEKMASCKAYVTTAGFESVCEAMYMGKPVLMVPVEGHYEQACNAIDGEKAGAGISSTHFDMEKLYHYLSNHQPVKDKFQKWANSAHEHFLKHLQ